MLGGMRWEQMADVMCEQVANVTWHEVGANG